MAGRPKTSDGNTVLWAVKIPPSLAAAADAERGDLSRADWTRTIIESAVRKRPAAKRATRSAGSDRVATVAHGASPEAPPVATAPSGPKPTSAKSREQCAHRNHGRFCGQCGRLIGKDGYPAA